MEERGDVVGKAAVGALRSAATIGIVGTGGLGTRFAGRSGCSRLTGLTRLARLAGRLSTRLMAVIGSAFAARFGTPVAAVFLAAFGRIAGAGFGAGAMFTTTFALALPGLI